MRPSTSAATVGAGFLLLVAWLASAVGVPEAPPPPPRGQEPSSSTQLAQLREDVQRQSARLRQRLASAPAPGPTDRNPFRFAPRPAPRGSVPPAPAAEPEAMPAPIPESPPEPLLVLIGIAERRQIDGVVRTAIISGGADDLHLVTDGEQFAGAYRVRAVGADVVELERIATGEIFRLRLQ